MPRQEYFLLNSFQQTAAHFPHLLPLRKQTVLLNTQRGEEKGSTGIHTDRNLLQLQAGVNQAFRFQRALAGDPS